LRKNDGSIEKQALEWNWQGVRRRGRPKQNWKRAVVEERQNVVIHGERLKGWRRTETDGGALQMPYVPRGTKGHKTKS
jgi:hypothetical protein